MTQEVNNKDSGALGVEGFDERLLLHTDNGMGHRITLFFALESALVAALAIVWSHHLGAIIVCGIALVLTVVMMYPLIRLGYALQKLQRWLATGRDFRGRTEFYRAYLALGKIMPWKQCRKLTGSKWVYAVCIPLIFAGAWIITGVTIGITWALRGDIAIEPG